MADRVLAIAHVEKSSPPLFTLSRRAEGNFAAPVAICSPSEFPVADQPNSNLMRELRWYLEGFLDYPFPPETGHAEHVLDALKGWGTQAFNALFDRGGAGEWLGGSGVIQVRSDDPNILSWPWEGYSTRRPVTWPTSAAWNAASMDCATPRPPASCRRTASMSCSWSRGLTKAMSATVPSPARSSI
jgi:hypothetical protein